jgi:uncharacterized LabA/DUF88 family protein
MRTVVFLDEKNVYHGARRAFFQPSDHFTRGNFLPMALGGLIAARQPIGTSGERELVEVRLYTGAPNPNYDSQSHGAHIRQREAWEMQGVTIVSRPLRYARNRPPGEQKGVDVAMAVDFVTMAVEGAYDVGIIFSTDTDLRPAVEFVAQRGMAVPEVACWWSSKWQSHLSVPGLTIWSHRLTEEDYNRVSDYTDYNLGRSA